MLNMKKIYRLLHNKFLHHAIYIGQIFHIFLLFFDKKKIIIIDQHAAHEQILFEKFIKNFEQCKKENIYKIANKKIKIYLNNQEYLIIKKNLKLIIDMGFFCILNENKILFVYKYLACYKFIFFYSFIKEFIRTYNEKIPQIIIKIRFLKMYFQLNACKRALTIGHVVSSSKANYIKKSLNNLANNSYCPHGRPIMKVISLDNLMKNFLRQNKK